MKQEEQPLLPPHQSISFKIPTKRSVTRFLSFLICLGILTACFAVSGVWKNGAGWFGSELDESGSAETTDSSDWVTPPKESLEKAPEAEIPIPEEAVAVISKNLARAFDASAFIENQTAYSIDFRELNEMPLAAREASGSEPLVLILHTHATEAYLPSKVSYLQEPTDRVLYSTNEARSVVSVGEALCETLNQKGISALHCTQKHGKDGTLQNAYADANACIRAYLEQYPSIQYVIDLHRDGILDQEGNLVGAQAELDGESCAQVLAVVGSDGNGTPCSAWKANLSLAVQLLGRLNQSAEDLSRGVSLRNASYNQELAYRSLLLEIGSAGNTCEEAIRAARLVGEVLAQMILEAREL